MGEFPLNKSFEEATVFESGYAHGFAQFEVRQIRFHIAPLAGGGEYEAATFTARGRRSQKTVPVNQLVVIGGCGHPRLEVDTIRRSGSVVHRKAKFYAFSKEWDELLAEYLASLGPGLQIIVDGRKRPGLTDRSELERSYERLPTIPERTNQRYVDEMNSASSFSEGAVESLLIDRYERDPDARRVCLDHYGYVCQVCGTMMSETYGELGESYIHVHHRVLLSQTRQEHWVDPIRDLVPVCPNCHAMLHRSPTPLSVEDLAERVRSLRRDAAQQGVAADGATSRS